MLALLDVLRRRNAPATHGLTDTVVRHCRVGLTDIDFNLHLNNVRYLNYIERARLEHMLSTGLMWKFIRARINPLTANTEISYLRELRTWERFTVSARIVGWDEKYFYYEHRFLNGDKLCTHAYARLANLYRGKSIPMARAFELAGVEAVSPPLPEPVLIWRDMLAAKRDLTRPAPTASREDHRHVA